MFSFWVAMSINLNITEKNVKPVTSARERALLGLQDAKLRFSSRFIDWRMKKIYVGLAFVAEIS
jgi:hypothetical protein